MHREEDHSIQIYMRDIGPCTLLTREEEADLARRIRRGDDEARQRLIRCNLRLVVKIAHAYARLGLPLLDLISEGNLGLLKAVDRFDPKMGGKMSTYAAWWIKQSIRRALANQSKTIRLPSHLVDKIGRMRKAEQRLTAELGREPDEEELAAEVGVDIATISQWRTLTLRPASLDAPIHDGDGELNDLISDPYAVAPNKELADKQLRSELEPLLDRLPYREREILKRRFGLRGAKMETLVCIGRRFGITRERVRQIQNEAIAHLRELLESQDLPRPDGAPDLRWNGSREPPAPAEAAPRPRRRAKAPPARTASKKRAAARKPRISPSARTPSRKRAAARKPRSSPRRRRSHE